MEPQHPQKVLEDAVAMYSSRVAIALEQRQQRYRNTGMFVIMGEASRIVPDMQVLCLDREQLLNRIDPAHPMSPGALAMFERTGDEDSAVVFGVVFADRSVLTTVLAVHDAHRDR